MNTHWIDGKSTPGKGATIDVLNPATEELLDTIPSGSADDAAAAVAAAKRAGPA